MTNGLPFNTALKSLFTNKIRKNTPFPFNNVKRSNVKERHLGNQYTKWFSENSPSYFGKVWTR